MKVKIQNHFAISKRLFDFNDLNEVKLEVRKLSKNGVLNQEQAASMVRKWRSVKWKNGTSKKQKQMDTLINDLDSTEQQSLDDVKNMVNKYVSSGKVTRHEAGEVIKRWKNTEKRRIDRQINKKDKACFHCRQFGHKFSDCPEKDDEAMGTGICFKCGSTEHTSSRCPRKNVKGYPYATCFVCKRQGHISRDCEDNSHGIYPNGGSCNLCGSSEHLKNDCPERYADLKSKKESLVSISTNMVSGDDDVQLFDDSQSENLKKSKRIAKKIVHF